MDPYHIAKIIGLLLIKDHNEKEMIRLAFDEEALLHAIMAKARKDLGLLPGSVAGRGPLLFNMRILIALLVKFT